MIVLDASAAVEVVLQTPAGAAIARRLANEAIHAPQLLELEVCSVLRRLEGKGVIITAADARTALGDFGSLAIERCDHGLLLPRIWMLRHNLTPYDAAYVALAELLEARLVTRDPTLAGAVGHQATIDLV